jgi:hypothetical protein
MKLNALHGHNLSVLQWFDGQECRRVREFLVIFHVAKAA